MPVKEFVSTFVKTTSASSTYIGRAPDRIMFDFAIVRLFTDGSYAIASDSEFDVLATAEILSDEPFMEDVRESMRELERGEIIPWEQVRAELGL